uniref:Ig-like domain-containing protein n=1 Tax=Poecilia latipinna TaxID=48699 RepID=A0A3B3VWH8_9TELE
MRMMIKSSYTYPSRIDGKNAEVKTMFWFTKENNQVPVDLKKDSDYKSRITYESTKSSSILTIKDLKQRDSAEYKFKFITNQPGREFTGSPGVTLTVLGNIFLRSETQTELKCESSCDLTKPPSYVWFNKKKKMEEQTSSILVSVRDGDRYSCSVKGHDNHRSASVYAPEFLSAKLISSGQITEGQSVTLSCSSGANPAANYTWRKNNNQSVVSKDQQFVLSSILSSDSGQYYCTAQNELGEKTSGPVSVQVTCESNWFHYKHTSSRCVVVSKQQQQQQQQVYLELVYLVTALVPSDTACLASSPGSRRRTAVWISLELMVERLL